MKTLHVLNLGAGVQSTTLYLMFMDGEIEGPQIDCAIFADTGDEPEAVYDHLRWLIGLGGPPILVRSAGCLSEALLCGMDNPTGRFASIPAFMAHAEGIPGGIGRRQCTGEYKVRVVEQTIRRELLGLAPGRPAPKGTVVVQSLGLSLDEPNRIISTKARFQRSAWSTPRFPLFDLEMTRRDCRAYLRERVPHEVPRSACVFCPYRDNDGWRDLRDNYPADFEKACRVDEGLRKPGARAAAGLDRLLYIHRSCRPLRVAPIDTPESRGEQRMFDFGQDCEGMCGL